MDIENLNFKNVFVCAQGVEVAANAIKALGKPEYEPGIAALLRLAHDLYDRGAMQAQRPDPALPLAGRAQRVSLSVTAREP